jgi:hypothetical protein
VLLSKDFFAVEICSVIAPNWGLNMFSDSQRFLSYAYFYNTSLSLLSFFCFASKYNSSQIFLFILPKEDLGLPVVALAVLTTLYLFLVLLLNFLFFESAISLL